MASFSSRELPRAAMLGVDLPTNALDVSIGYPYPFAKLSLNAIIGMAPDSTTKVLDHDARIDMFDTHTHEWLPIQLIATPFPKTSAGGFYTYFPGMDRIAASRAVAVTANYAMHRYTLLDSWNIRLFLNGKGVIAYYQVQPPVTPQGSTTVDYVSTQAQYFTKLSTDIGMSEFTDNDIIDVMRTFAIAPAYGVSLYDREDYNDPDQSVDVVFLTDVSWYVSSNTAMQTQFNNVVRNSAPAEGFLPPNLFKTAAPMPALGNRYFGYTQANALLYVNTIEHIFQNAMVNRSIAAFTSANDAAKMSNRDVLESDYFHYVNYHRNIDDLIRSPVLVEVSRAGDGQFLYSMPLTIPEKIYCPGLTDIPHVGNYYYPRQRISAIYHDVMSNSFSRLYDTLGVRSVQADQGTLPPTDPASDYAWKVDDKETAAQGVIVYVNPATGELRVTDIPVTVYKLAIKKAATGLRYPTTSGGAISAADLSAFGVQGSDLSKFLPLAIGAVILGFLKARALH